MKAVVDAMRAGLPSNDAVREGSRSCTRARYGVLHFERKYLRTNMEICSMTTVVRCPRTGRACSEPTCQERHWCREMFERGLSPRGLPLKRKF